MTVETGLFKNRKYVIIISDLLGGMRPHYGSNPTKSQYIQAIAHWGIASKYDDMIIDLSCF
jgi:hypothetical protein